MSAGDTQGTNLTMSSRALRRAQKGKKLNLKLRVEMKTLSLKTGKIKTCFNNFHFLKTKQSSESEPESSGLNQKAVGLNQKLWMSNLSLWLFQRIKRRVKKCRIWWWFWWIIWETLWQWIFYQVSSSHLLIRSMKLYQLILLGSTPIPELKKKFGGAVSGGNSVLSEINFESTASESGFAKTVKRKPFKRKMDSSLQNHFGLHSVPTNWLKR